jgi:hypothetical protein
VPPPWLDQAVEAARKIPATTATGKLLRNHWFSGRRSPFHTMAVSIDWHGKGSRTMAGTFEDRVWSA